MVTYANNDKSSPLSFFTTFFEIKQFVRARVTNLPHHNLIMKQTKDSSCDNVASTGPSCSAEGKSQDATRKGECDENKRKREEREDTPDPEFCCAICHEILLDPVSLPCGHNFDNKCMHNLKVASEEPGIAQRCPTCRADFHGAALQVRYQHP